ncbi:MAG: hypothetical protein IPK07_25860 [Deltaproteobacteria bacterium]|jgi:hypothetical protein|nr:hypothetical protein [Deltaproteobacteria bacterium]
MLASTAPGVSAVLVLPPNETRLCVLRALCFAPLEIYASLSVVPPSSRTFATGARVQSDLIVAAALDLWIVDLAA